MYFKLSFALLIIFLLNMSPAKSMTSNFEEFEMEDLTFINNYSGLKLNFLQDITFPDRRSHQDKIAGKKDGVQWYYGVSLKLHHGVMKDVKFAAKALPSQVNCTLGFQDSIRVQNPVPFILYKNESRKVDRVVISKNRLHITYNFKFVRDPQYALQRITLRCYTGIDRSISISQFNRAINGILELR